MSTWNYRVLAREYNGEPYYSIHEVYYDEDGNPNGYVDQVASVNGEDISSIRWSLNKMKEALNKTVLWHGDKFPQKHESKKGT